MIKTELNIKKKEPLGSGIEHTAFPFSAFKDKIIKTKSGNVEIGNNGKPKFVKTNPKANLDMDEMETFQNNPDLFAKVYKLTDRYAVIEKLNTKDLQRDIDMLTDSMIKFFIRNPQYAKNFTLKDPSNLEIDDFNLIATIHDNKKDIRLFKGIVAYAKDKAFALKLFTFIKKVQTSRLGKSPDLHDGNVGYDKEGNIKLLDF